MAKTKLARKISLPVLTLYGLGNIIGAGIYVLVGKVTGEAGYGTPFSFIIAGLIAAFTAVSYGLLSARYPVSAGTPVYIKKAFNTDWLSIAVGCILVLSGIVSVGALANGLVGYIAEFSAVSRYIVIPAAFVLLGAVTIKGIDEAAKLAVIITLIEVGGLLLVAWLGLTSSGLQETLGSMAGELRLGSLSGIVAGAFLSFYAFIGFEDVVNVAEEVKEPRRAMPRAIILALLFASALYMLVAVAALNVLTPAQLDASNAPLADVFSAASGSTLPLLTIIGLIAIVNGMIAQIIMSSRILYGMANVGWLPRWLASVHPRTKTPVKATVLVLSIMTVTALLASVESLARITSFALLVIFILVNSALYLLIRRSEIKGKAWVPLAGAVTSLGMLVIEIVQNVL